MKTEKPKIKKCLKKMKTKVLNWIFILKFVLICAKQCLTISNKKNAFA